MEYIPVVTLEESVVKDILEKDEMYLIQSDMVTYASVFAQIKITGVIDKNLKANAILAMKRMAIIAQIQGYEESGIA